MYLPIFLIIILFIPGCISKDVHITDLNNSDGAGEMYRRVSLDEAIAVLKSDDWLRMERTTGYTIHNIVGRNIDRNASADHWIISVSSIEQFYFIYRSQEYSTMVWDESEKDHPINLSNAISPEELFVKQDALIKMLTENEHSTVDELELRNGIYYIRNFETGDEFKFYATTGMPIN